MSLHEYLQRDPACRNLAEGAVHAVAPLLEDPDPGPTLALLEDWSFELAARMPLPWNNHLALDALNGFLFQDLGFRGDQETYDHPDNAVFPKVLARRKGLPISLSILWLDQARRLGLDAVGVALPGHFITALRLDTGLVLIDPFQGGRSLGPQDAAELVRRGTEGAVPYHPDMLAPAPHRAILLRLVRNLYARFLRSAAWADAIWSATHMILLAPEDPLSYRDRALVHLQRNELPEALADLKEALRLDPQAAPELEAWFNRMSSS